MYHEYETLADLTGGVCASLPTEESFFAPETAELCNKYILRNPAYSDWYTGVTENASYTEQSFGMRFTHK